MRSTSDLFSDQYSDLLEQFEKENTQFVKNLRYITAPKNHYDIVNLVDKNLHAIKKIFRSTAESCSEDRGFLEGDVSGYNIWEVLYLVVNNWQVVKRVNQLEVLLENQISVDDVLTGARKTIQVHKALNEKQVDKKLGDWIAYQFSQSGSHFESICSFFNEVVKTLWDMLSYVAQSIIIVEFRVDNPTKDVSMDAEISSFCHDIYEEDHTGQCLNQTLQEYNKHLRVLSGEVEGFSS